MPSFKQLNSLVHVTSYTLGLVTLSALQSVAQSSWPTGYYRASNRPEVYWLNSRTNTYCHVQNPSQMNMFGGFNQVRVVGTESFRSSSQFIGKCGWPDGFYRVQNRPEVYGLGNGFACWVSSPQMMNAYGGFSRVRVVENSSNLFAQRRNAGECVWPSR